MIKEFTLAELETFNGKNGQPAYVAYKGNVYEVSGMFKNGEHAGVSAGIDITKTFAKGPHSEAIFAKFQVVGKLV